MLLSRIQEPNALRMKSTEGKKKKDSLMKVYGNTRHPELRDLSLGSAMPFIIHVTLSNELPPEPEFPPAKIGMTILESFPRISKEKRKKKKPALRKGKLQMFTKGKETARAPSPGSASVGFNDVNNSRRGQPHQGEQKMCKHRKTGCHRSHPVS